jgi:hypothetical protein
MCGRSPRASRASSLATSLLAMVIFLVVVAMRADATTITAFPVDFSATEGSAFNGAVATFEDDNSAATPADFTATIDWGDGSPTTPGTIGASSAAFTVLGQHTYADEGTFTVTVTISDVSPGTGTATATDTATVGEADSLSGTPRTFPASVGNSFTTVVASFTDTLTSQVVSDFTATINWGDATTSAGTVSGGSGSFQVSGTHTYAGSGNFTVTVTLSDDAPGTATAQVSSTAVVSAAAVNVTATNFTVAEGATFNGQVGAFSASDTSKTAASFTATIAWGDATTTAGTVAGSSGSFTVSGTHTYADEGSFSTTVTVTQSSPSATGSANGTATVTEADALSGHPVTFTAQTGVPFNGPVATFTDTNTAAVPSDLVASINWGDGTPISPGTVTGGGGSFTVSGTHTYMTAGPFTVTVTLTDDAPGTATATATSTANVANGVVAAIPALSLPGLLALALGLGIAGLYLLRRRIAA